MRHQVGREPRGFSILRLDEWPCKFTKIYKWPSGIIKTVVAHGDAPAALPSQLFAAFWAMTEEWLPGGNAQSPGAQGLSKGRGPDDLMAVLQRLLQRYLTGHRRTTPFGVKAEGQGRRQ
ncbi:MAG: hypothetical protein EOP84_11170, partial [Verrucomicrobiaceae bacterium]